MPSEAEIEAAMHAYDATAFRHVEGGCVATVRQLVTAIVEAAEQAREQEG